MDTIFAVSSGAPPAAIAVLRISGPHALVTAAALAGSLPPERRAVLRMLRDPRDGTVLDHALILVFRGPTTATGEDLVELHLHGGRAVVAAVENALAVMPSLRRAESGEFTRRALTHGRIDLTQAEGLGDLLAAETETQRRAAITAAEGGIRRCVEQWSDRLLALSAAVEAALDFADEDDVSEAALDQVRADAALLARDIAAVLDQPPVERLRDGVRVVLAGPPNSGKSSLINAMADRNAAIVSSIAGTTRDRIEVPVQRGGTAYVLTDTAGLAEATADPIEQIGIERARSAMRTADIVLWLGDDQPPGEAIWLHARADLPTRETMPQGPTLAVSTATGMGMPTLWTHIEQRSQALLPLPNAIALNARQRDLAALSLDALRDIEMVDDILIIADDLREARSALHRITGHSDTEAMLDALFGTFCIGK